MTDSLPGSAWWPLGALQAEEGQWESALRSVNRALKLEPDNPDMLLSKGGTLHNLEDCRAAVDAFERALALTNVAQTRFDAFIGEGKAPNKLRLYEKAIEAFRQAQDIAPENSRCDPQLWVGLGESYHSLNRNQAACAPTRRAGDLIPPRDLQAGKLPRIHRGGDFYALAAPQNHR